MKYKNQVIISGGGGGGKSGSAMGASEAPNTLRSKQVAHIIDLLGEGEWEGLVDGPAGIYLNDVALFTPTTPTNDVVDLNQAGSESGEWTEPGEWNFKGISVEFRNGTQSQPAIRSASSSGSVLNVSLPVVNGTPVTTTITNPNIDTAIVNVEVQQLYQQNTENGSLSGYYVDVEIQARPSGGTWVSIKKDRIEGKTMTAYIRSYAVDLEALDSDGPWDVQVIRVSANDPDSSKHSEIRFLGVDLMSRDKFRYPNSVLCSIGVDASQLSSIPTRSYDCKMARVRVPSNYNPVTRAYTGTWDGSFQIAWTDNPAWCLYDMATNERYGLGEWVDETLTDKWALYTIGQYCDQLVPDGLGSTEPRFTLNLYLQTAEEAITLLQNMASVFRGILFYLNESITALQDAPSDSVYQFNPSNVVDGTFSYAGASGSMRHTVVMVVWNNPEIGYKQDVEVVEDPDGLARFGYRPVTVQAMGCTSRGQAHRLGMWTLYVEQYESDIVTFSTALEGTGVQPGNIIDVFDPTRANARLGGRVLGVSGQVVALDAETFLPAGTHDFSFISDDGEMLSRTFTVSNGNHSSITLNGSGAVPSINSPFGIQLSVLMSQQFRIVSIAEKNEHVYEIAAVAHNASKYAYVEYGLKLSERPIRADFSPPPAPSDVDFYENLYYLADGSIRNKLIVSWEQQQTAASYLFSYQIGSGNWSEEMVLTSHSYTIMPVSEGWTYSVRIRAVTLNGIRSGLTEASYLVIGERAPPPEFDQLIVTVEPDGTRLINFGYTVTEKPVDYKGARVRYYAGETSDWSVMTDFGVGFFTASPVETGQVPVAGIYTIAARPVDMTDVEGDPIFVTVDLAQGRTALADAIDEIEDTLVIIADDNMLSKGEKGTYRVLFGQIAAYYEMRSVEAAEVPEVAAEASDFEDAFTALETYLTSAFDPFTNEGVGLGGSDWNNSATDSQIHGPTYRQRFQDFFDAAEALDSALFRARREFDDEMTLAIQAANDRMDAVASDNVLSKGEKAANLQLWQQCVQFYTAKDAEAAAAGITTERTALQTAYNSLEAYLGAPFNAGTNYGVGTGVLDWRDVNTDSQIHGPTFRTYFDVFFNAAETLHRKLTESARTVSTWAGVTGTGRPTDYADPTNAALQSGQTISGGGITLSSGGVFRGGKTSYGVGTGIFLGYESGAYKFDIGSPTNYLRWTGTSLAIIGDITGTSNIDITGTAKFSGALTVSGYSYAGVFNEPLGSKGGVLGFGTGSGASGVQGVGQSSANGILGVGLSGSTGVYGQSVGGIGVKAQAVFSGTALAIDGPASMTNSTMITNLNADMVDGVQAANLCQLVVGNTGTAYVAGTGLNLITTVSGVTVTCSSNYIVIEPVSDARIKKDIEDESLGLEFILTLRPRTYRLIADPSLLYHGFIYQEVADVLKRRGDSLSQDRGNNYGGVDYMSLISPLVKAVQQQQSQIQGLQQLLQNVISTQKE